MLKSVVVVLSLTSCSASAFAARCVPVYDATLYERKTERVAKLMKPITVVYGTSEWWRDGETDQVNPDSGLVRKWVDAANENSQATVVDIENWPTSGTLEVVNHTITRFTTAIRAARSAGRIGEIGIYGVLPSRSYWGAVSAKGSERYRQWRDQNSAIAPLAAEVDVLYPSLYTFYEDLNGWKQYATENIAEARRISQGKPVKVFLWPQFHESNVALDGQFLPAQMWAAQLELVSDQADGIVIWGGYKARWDDNAPWWNAVVKHIEENCNRKPMAPTDINVTQTRPAAPLPVS